jgi:hypothetical protein
MKGIYLVTTILISISALPTVAGEVDGKAVLGGAVGGAAGAAIGSAVGGREGAIIGGALGGAAGAAVTASDESQTQSVPVQKRVIVHEYKRGRHDRGLHPGHYKHKHKYKHKHDD